MSKSETIPGSGTARRAPPERASSPPSDVAPRSSAFAGADGAKRCTSCQTVLADAVSVVARVVLASGEIERIGSAECPRCGGGWLFADCSESCDEAEVRTELNLFAESAQQRMQESDHGA